MYSSNDMTLYAHLLDQLAKMGFDILGLGERETGSACYLDFTQVQCHIKITDMSKSPISESPYSLWWFGLLKDGP